MLVVVVVVVVGKIDRELQVPGGTGVCSVLWHIAENNSTFRYLEGALLVVVVVVCCLLW